MKCIHVYTYTSMPWNAHHWLEIPIGVWDVAIRTRETNDDVFFSKKILLREGMTDSFVGNEVAKKYCSIRVSKQASSHKWKSKVPPLNLLHSGGRNPSFTPKQLRRWISSPEISWADAKIRCAVCEWDWMTRREPIRTAGEQKKETFWKFRMLTVFDWFLLRFFSFVFRWLLIIPLERRCFSSLYRLQAERI